jgi:hypothetical protein
MSFYLNCKITYFRSRFETLKLTLNLKLQTSNKPGTVAEGLGSALQKLLQQFESVRYLETRC